MRMNRRELIFLGLMLGILLAAWMLVLRPRGKEIDRMQTRIQEKQRILGEIETSRPRAVGNLKRDIRELETIVADRRKRLPREEKLEKVFQNLSELAEANELRSPQIKTKQIAPKPSTEESPSEIEEQELMLELEGTFPGIQGFLQSLEKHSRIFHVDEIRIQRKTKKTGDSTLQVNLRVRAFHRKGEETS